MNSLHDYSSLPSHPSATCRSKCKRSNRVYAALSLDLNRRAFEQCRPDALFKPYIFKVGSTRHRCHDRWRSLCESRKPRQSTGGVIFEEPSYAGVGDWKILKCWTVDAERYDDRGFKPWLRRSAYADMVKSVGAYEPNGITGIAKGPRFLDLFSVSESYVRDTASRQLNDSLNEEIIAALVDTIKIVMSSYHQELRSASNE